MEIKLHMASISKIYRKKELSGHGVIDIELWNTGPYCGLIFNVLTEEKSLWARCTRKYTLKNKHFWTMENVTDWLWVIGGPLKYRKVA